MFPSFVQSAFCSCMFYIRGFNQAHTENHPKKKKKEIQEVSKSKTSICHILCIVFITIQLAFALYQALYVIKGHLKCTEDVLAYANTMPLNTRNCTSVDSVVSQKPGVCPRTKPPWVLKNDYPDYEHSLLSHFPALDITPPSGELS